MNLHEKHILITGGGTGLGAYMAVEFAQQGATVVICGRALEPLTKTAQRHKNISAQSLDVTDETAVTDFFATQKPFDIVIANAGSSASAAFKKTDMQLWRNMLDINLTGVYLTFREALKKMDKKWGRLIAVSSTAGLKGYSYVSAYVAAKHGVIGLIRALSLELAHTGITANAICPGFLDTEMTQRSIDNIMAQTMRSQEDTLAELVKFNPQKKLITPAEVTSSILWLCDENAAAINGQAISISGGEI